VKPRTHWRSPKPPRQSGHRRPQDPRSKRRQTEAAKAPAKKSAGQEASAAQSPACKKNDACKNGRRKDGAEKSQPQKKLACKRNLGARKTAPKSQRPKRGGHHELLRNDIDDSAPADRESGRAAHRG